MRMDTTTVNLAASAFTHPQGYLELAETLATTSSVEEFLNGNTGVEFVFASKLSNEQLAFDAYGTSYLDKIFKKSFDDNDWNIGIYIGTVRRLLLIFSAFASAPMRLCLACLRCLPFAFSLLHCPMRSRSSMFPSHILRHRRHRSSAGHRGVPQVSGRGTQERL